MSQDKIIQMLKLCAQVTKHIFNRFSNGGRCICHSAFFKPVFLAGAVGDKRIAAVQKCSEITDIFRRRFPMVPAL